MKIRKIIEGSNGDVFIKTFHPYKVIIEDGMTTVYLSQEAAINLVDYILFKNSWWNASYKESVKG